MNRRRVLERVLIALLGFGLVMAMVPFFSGGDSGQVDAGALLDIELSRLPAGESLLVIDADRSFLILHRTPVMLEGLRQPRQPLADPWSQRSQQPAFAGNVYRSLRPDYLVLDARCDGGSVEYRGRNLLGSGFPDGALVCTASNNYYDLAGRVLVGSSSRLNLAVPVYRFLNATTLRIGEAP